MNKFVKFNNSLTFQDGGIEALKWLALASMILDHINKYLFNYSIDYFFEIGRLAMPLFGFIFAYNMARDKKNPKIRESGNAQGMVLYTSAESHYSIEKNDNKKLIGIRLSVTDSL